MTKYTLRHSIIGIATVVSASFGFAGGASADASIGITGPDSNNQIVMSSGFRESQSNTNITGVGNSNEQIAQSGNVNVNGNTVVGGGFGIGNGDWSSWSPQNWQAHGASFNQWWGAMMGQISQMGAMNGWGGGNSWMPGGGNWKSSWSNWDPNMWMSNGQSFGNWDSQIMGFMNSNMSNWMNNWPVSGGGISSGNATNNNNTSTNIGISNSGGNVLADNTGGGGGNASIFLTGPGSNNTIDENSSQRFSSQNTNVTDVSNQNFQQARSGDVNANGNTVVGGASSGNASNSNNTETNVGISNASPEFIGGGGGNGGNVSIGTTGPDSNNRVSTDNSTSMSSSNFNETSVSNDNEQVAMSGDVNLNRNTVAGGASSGNAGNWNGTNTNIGIRNN